VDDVNYEQKKVLIKKIFRHYGEKLSCKTFGIWGLSFKPNTDDMREAPSLVIINALLEAGAQVQAYDPVAMEEAKHMIGHAVMYANDAVSAIKNADALILITEWPEFRLPDWEMIKSSMKAQVIFDGRNIYHAADMKKKGFTYYGIGMAKTEA
jgi:UDPglucose 6-dehydrogenase